MSTLLKDFFSFRRMLTPVLIQLVFWLGTLACFGTGILDFWHQHIISGVLAILLGPILVRIGCEILIIFFRINQTLTEIRNRQV